MQNTQKVFHRMLGLFLLVTVVLLAVVLMALYNVSRSTATADWVNHTHATRAEAAEVQSSLHAAEAALRTFLLTGDPRDQSDYRVAFSELAEHVDVAKALTRQSPEQYALITRLEELLAKRAALARESIRIRREGSADELKALLANDAGSHDVREIGRLVEGFRNEQAVLLNARDRASFLQAQTTRWTVLAGLVLDLLLLAGAAWLVRDDLRARHRAAELLQQTNEQLEARVRQRTAELSLALEKITDEDRERQWTNKSLEHQLRYHQLMVDSISDLVFVLTKALNISRVNPAVVHLTGWEAPDLINRPLSQVVQLTSDPAGAGELVPDPVKRAIKEGRDLREQPAVVTDSGGRQTPVRFSLFPLRDQDKVIGAVVTLQLNPVRTTGTT